MRRVLADLASFARQYMRSRVGAFFTFVFPILLILLFGAIFTQTGSTSVNVPVQDLNATPTSQRFVSLLNNTSVVKVSMITRSADIQDYIKSNSLTVVLQIPADFEAQVANWIASNGTAPPVNLTLYGDVSQSTTGIVQGVVEAVAEQMNFNLVNKSPAVRVTMSPIVSSQFRYMDFFLPGIVGMTIMTTSMYSMTSVCGEYRTRRYFKLLATTTLTKAEWLTSKILWYTISLLLSLLVTVAIAFMVFDAHVTIDPIVIAFVAAGAVLFTSLGMLFGTVIRDPESGVALANAVGFPMMFLSGSFWSLDAMPSYMRTIAQALPLTYVNDGLRDAMVYGNVTSALTNLGIVAVLAVILFVLAARLMSWKER